MAKTIEDYKDETRMAQAEARRVKDENHKLEKQLQIIDYGILKGKVEAYEKILDKLPEIFNRIGEDK